MLPTRLYVEKLVESERVGEDHVFRESISRLLCRLTPTLGIGQSEPATQGTGTLPQIQNCQFFSKTQ